jgi:DNA-binding MarR family transcriptional regulator
MSKDSDMTISKVETDVTFKDLARVAGLSVSEARKSVDELEAKGLVRIISRTANRVRMTFIEPSSGEELHNVFDSGGHSVGMVTKKGNKITDVPCVQVPLW